jgi:diguanylate cyclase (GGDEF)-like protein
VALVGCVTLFAGSLVLRSEPVYSALWDGWIGNLALLASTVACFVRAIVGGPRRAAAAWLGIGMFSFLVGNVIFVGWTQLQTDPPVPSPADIAYLGIYPFVAAAVICLVRNDEGSLAKSLWLDGALGAGGAATALAAVLSPVLSGIKGDLREVLVGAAFPVADLLLIAMICGLLTVRGVRGGSMWLWLAGGLTTFCVADAAYALRLVSDTYAVGSVLDGLWAVSLMVMALAIWRPERPPAIDVRRPAAILAIPMLATLTAVVVLVISSFGQLPTVVIALATFTLGLAVVRTLVSFREVQRLSDARRQAVTDELTGLGNRRYLFERGAQRLQVAEPPGRIAMILIDLDMFKEVNDTLGHHGGDELLRETARRLGARVSPPDLLVRLGGDEFALVITLAAGDDARRIAERILERLTRPFVINAARVRVAASAGVAVSDNPSLGIADLLRRADVAMYAAKSRRSRIALYDPQLDEANRSRLETVRDIDAAIAQDQLVLHYQPKIAIQTGRVTGAEALVRWQHPTRGLLYPDAFLSVVERSGQMGALTQLVLDAAIRQLATWRAADLTITVAVNLSASDLLDEHLAERIAGQLAEHAVPVSALELEITETVLMTDPERARSVLEQLRGLGLRIAVDDYGTGYCALAYLRDLPVDELKIDRSFIADFTADRRSVAIVRSTIELAHALDLKVVAEGVEHQHDLDALAAFDCDFAQGYHFSRPLPADAFAAWAQARVPDRTPEIPTPSGP